MSSEIITGASVGRPESGAEIGAKIGFVLGLTAVFGGCALLPNLDPQVAKYVRKHLEVTYSITFTALIVPSAIGAAAGAFIEKFRPASRLMKRLELNTYFQQFRENVISFRTALGR